MISHLNFSVLLSVYKKEIPANMSLALDSIWTSQTVRPTEIILVKDGPLTPELEAVITDFQERIPLKVVALEQNQGLGLALNAGLQACSYDIIARMDTDDVSKPNRFEKQLTFLEQNPDIDVVGAWIDEFIGTPDNVVSSRILPEFHDELYRYGQRRNPLNHPVVMFRRSKILAAGNYQHFPLFEDWYMWARLMMDGGRLHNIQEPLLWFRTTADVYKRRSGFKYACDEIVFQRALWKLKYIGAYTFATNLMIRFPIRLIPNSVRGYIYRTKLRAK